MSINKKFLILFFALFISRTSYPIPSWISWFFQSRAQADSQAFGQAIGNGLADGLGRGMGNAVDQLWARSNANFAADGQGRQASGRMGSVFALQFAKFGGVTVATAAGTATAWFGSKVLWNHIETVLKRPVLILDTSYKSAWQKVKEKLIAKKEPELVKPLIFSKELEKNLDRIVQSTKAVNKEILQGNKNVFYKNILLHGVPGGGKTEFAKKLAKESGLTWVRMSGAGFAKFSKEAGIAELDKLFAWANKQKGGLLIFIDEAESFLSKREKMEINSYEYQLLETFLNHTDSQSNKVLLVYATNHPEVLDNAVMSRVAESIHITLPTVQERQQIIKAYSKLYLEDAFKNNTLMQQSIRKVITEQKINELAQQTENFSPRDLATLVSIIASDALVSAEKVVTNQLVTEALLRMKNKKENNFNQTAVAA